MTKIGRWSLVPALVLCGCVTPLQLFLGLKDELNPVALSHPNLNSSAWEVFSELGPGSDSGIFARNFDGDIIGRSVATGRVMEVTGSGSADLYDLTTDELLDSHKLGAVGGAWSNDGRRMAVVTRDVSMPAADAYQLLILNSAFEEQLRFSLDLPLPDASSEYRAAIVSWRADDSQIAISTDASPEGCRDGVLNAAVVARCVVITVSDGSSSVYEFTNVHFLDGDWVVGTRPGSPIVETSAALERVYAMRLEDGKISQQVQMVGSELAVASYPPDGVFASAEGGVFVAPDCIRSVYLRSRVARSGALGSMAWAGSPVSVFPTGD